MSGENIRQGHNATAPPSELPLGDHPVWMVLALQRWIAIFTPCSASASHGATELVVLKHSGRSLRSLFNNAICWGSFTLPESFLSALAQPIL
jgi:hypothetical protein